MNRKEKGLSFGRFGMIRGSLRRNRGRRETSIPFSEIVFGDNHLLESPGKLKGVNRYQDRHLWSVGAVKGFIGTETTPTEKTKQELSILFSKIKQWRIWAVECRGSMQPWTTSK
jgi:hypothetical protein